MYSYVKTSLDGVCAISMKALPDDISRGTPGKTHLLVGSTKSQTALNAFSPKAVKGSGCVWNAELFGIPGLLSHVPSISGWPHGLRGGTGVPSDVLLFA